MQGGLQVIEAALIALVASVLGALVTGYFLLRGKQTEYANDYYKIVINRRVAAYEALETLVVRLRPWTPGVDGKPYHSLFTEGDLGEIANKLTMNINDTALWISSEANYIVRDINVILNRSSTKNNIVEFATENFDTIVELRKKLERVIAQDMLRLHDVRRFLRQKAR